ncbi:phosphohydrolase [Mucilaginibacter sp. Bleaf8]|uniref:Pycsar system effector family protein n=1 Tax=Mucilaginibacter sp. Bleaf8 TaxID=2834430 RepID=UPI001BCD99E4|nr:Pycsar system effector family protein [Mucilaginibacter sp. Bleaf8]MBS7564633.1 phosphohydrolase [Mucilaginibacter sp. Bleaf8]
MNYQETLDRVKQYVLSYYAGQDTKMLVYHNLTHIQEVVKSATQISNHYQLNDRDFFIVIAAAWFHDTGYFVNMQQHEEESARIAEGYLRSEHIDEAIITEVKGCIMATKMPQAPTGLLQEIICDADLFHLGTDTFSDKNKLMRKEFNTVFNRDMSKHDWRQKTIRFLESHHYHTDYARLLLDAGKVRNVQALKDKEAAWQAELQAAPVVESKPESKLQSQPVQNAPQAVAEATKIYQEKKVDKKERPEKGIETMFRVTSSNHQRLSDMADNKAHIMITVNSIILSAIISLLLRRLEDYSYLIIPTAIILLVSLTTMVFAILATRPSLPPGTFTRQDVDEKKVNLLFFGNFYRMSLQDYIAGMRDVMADREFLYGSLIIDVYSQGIVLGRKYRLLRASYNIFMFGLIISVLAFIVASVINGNGH